MSRTTYRSNKIRTIVAVGVFAAFAYVCCVLFHFKASFLTFDLKDAVMTVGAMLFGPSYGIIMSVIVAIIESLTISDTGPYGFIMNVLSSCTFVGIGSLIYSFKRNMKGAVIGMLCASAAMVAVMLSANLLITPFYMNVAAADVAALIPTLLFPFNLTKAVFNASIVFMIYKPVSNAIRHAGFVQVGTYKSSGVPSSSVTSSARGKFIPVATVIAGVAAAAALIYFFVALNGSFSFGK